MPNCNSCDATVLRTDAFCGTCGEAVPGGKPVVPIARESRQSGVQSAPDRMSGAFAPPSATAASARAMAVVAISDPDLAESRDAEVNRTGILQREPLSEPAPVLPLNRKKNGTESERGEEPIAAESGRSAAQASIPDRDTSLPNIPIPAGPPILASDLLREQMRPASPGEKSLRRTAVGLSALGAAAVLFAGGVHPLTFVSLALLITMVTLALTPMSYRGRAIMLFMVGTVATGVALWQQAIHAIAPGGVILAAAAILLSGSLLFRAYYRGASLARVAVTLGVLALGTWFVLSGGHESLVMLDGNWHSWAPASTQMTLALLALLSLMAFMDSSTRGGSHVWAVAVLVVYSIHIGLLVASEVWPVVPKPATIEGPAIAAIIAGLVGTVVAGMALAQVLVVVYQSALNRVKAKASASAAP